MTRTLTLTLALALAACDDGGGDAAGPFRPIGQTDAGATTDARVDGADEGTSALPLRLRLVPIEQDSGALRITDITFAPGGDSRFLVTDKDGEVILMQLEVGRARRLGGFQVPGTWIDSDAGLIAAAFDPDFAENGFFYLGLSTSQETNVIRRYTLDPDDFAASLASEVEIISITGPRSPRSWHNVGSIGFTDEGYLWALFGDKVLDEPALDVQSPLGSLVRIIPDRRPFPTEGGYTVPDDNPYADGSGHPAVYAKGFRSPWKGHYVDGRWFTSDVGLDTFEEVNLIDRPGLSFGWPAVEGPCEGDACMGYAPPFVSWGRSGSHPFVREDPEATASRLRSAWVGWQYRPNDLDPYGGRWDDVITFGDAFVGYIRAQRTDGQGSSWHVAHHTFVTGWSQGPDGFVYVTALGTWPVDAPVAPSPIMRAVLAD
ncbi:MAG: PQQ-dependent sugar dehydrogenase [Myxococcales bacterium]|nr:PQQ-dependent sugar dehydrogenase [Myxococcales bacterium]MCB9550051.1 PQQ-dependent sugar dehydrogenase [Myxococcales bacterium]